jgi:dTDP-4-dehydrorhamnose 3,5-epimerase
VKITETQIAGLLIIQPRVFEDERGYFFESYNRQQLMDAGIGDAFVQDNEAQSDPGTIRGLHYQISPFAQSKLVRVIVGSVYDVAVDIRPGSDTYGKWFGIELSAQNKKQLYIPRGFAHGYVALEPGTIFAYKCDNRYSRDHEGGIRFDDPTLGIHWPLDGTRAVISEKDQNLLYFGAHRTS